jgi:hypothetical protein
LRALCPSRGVEVRLLSAALSKPASAGGEPKLNGLNAATARRVRGPIEVHFFDGFARHGAAATPCTRRRRRVVVGLAGTALAPVERQFVRGQVGGDLELSRNLELIAGVQIRQ